jgi:predicted nucleic acid-binding protein
MPAGASEPDLLLDTSAAVALVVADHPDHLATLRAVGDRRLGLAGHAVFETLSVLTRLPPPARRMAAAVTRLLEATFPESRFLSARASKALLSRLGTLGISGGAVYDALVGACALEHDIPLATRDRRALETYRALEVRIQLLA